MHALTYGLLLAFAALYAAGALRRSRRGRPLRRASAVCFAGGVAVLAIALVSPLHDLAEAKLWAHMVQHELLMVVAAPLLVAARPLGAFAWVIRLRIPGWLSDPYAAFVLHAAAIWLWHIPGAFAWSLQNEALHFAQHASFFVTALMLWESVLGKAGPALMSVFGTMLHTGALGALLALSSRTWYAGYALEDQQLAGLIMWVPAGLAYPIAAVFVVSRSLRRLSATPRRQLPAG